MGERIDDEELYTRVFRRLNRFQISRGAERRFHGNGQIFADANAACGCADVQTARAVFCVNDTDLFPERCVREAGMLGVDEAVSQLKGTERLATAGTASEADLQPRHLSFCLLNLDRHV